MKGNIMEDLKGFEKKYLRGLAHGLKPLVLIGREGLTAGATRAADEGLAQHELIKIKFNDFKESEQKKALIAEMTDKTKSAFVGMIGHTATLYRRHADPDKREIKLPTKGIIKKKPQAR